MSILQLPLDESIDGLDLRGHHDRHCRSFSLGSWEEAKKCFFLFNLVCLYELQLIELSWLFHVCFYLMLQYV